MAPMRLILRVFLNALALYVADYHPGRGVRVRRARQIRAIRVPCNQIRVIRVIRVPFNQIRATV
jgi:hypothetical protein